MTKELSKQLCELCGIEGKWIEYETETTDGCINLGSKLVYPDFTKPENFVRLFELKVKKEYKETCTVAEWVTYSNIYIFDSTDFLKSLIVIIKSEKYEIDALKQSIREAEWVYE